MKERERMLTKAQNEKGKIQSHRVFSQQSKKMSKISTSENYPIIYLKNCRTETSGYSP